MMIKTVREHQTTFDLSAGLVGILLFFAVLVVFNVGGARKAFSQDHQHAQAEQSANLQLGDDGYMHAWLHVHYQAYFGQIRCPCKEGECRPTTWQRDPKDARVIQVWINRAWVSVSDKVDIRTKKDIPVGFPQELRKFDAHACAYGPKGKVVITCVWILGSDV